MQRSPRRFAIIFAQLLVLGIATFFMFRPWFGGVALVVGGWAVHYWLPLRAKEPFWFALSAAALLTYAGPKMSAVVLATYAVGYLVAALPVPWLLRLVLVLCMFPAAALAWRALHPSARVRWFLSITLIQMITYIYEVKHMKGRPSLFDYVRYQVWLPTYVFQHNLIMPYQTLTRSFLQKEVHETAQKGIWWILLGVIQMVAFLVTNEVFGPLPWTFTVAPASLGELVLLLVRCYLYYLVISGAAHVSAGVMLLFGYDLPKTNQSYALATGPLDFWRRVNIYWKDAMMRVFYMPTYFWLRKRSDFGAKVAGVAAAFGASALFHMWRYGVSEPEQGFWYGTEVWYWTIFFVVAVADMALEGNGAKRKPARPGAWSLVSRALKIAAMFLLVSSLWALTRSASVEHWLEFMFSWAAPAGASTGASR